MSKPIFDKFVVGLTGGIGSGKSTVAQLFRDLGIQVVDADLASRAVVEPGSPALADIAQHFSSDILLPTGELDRAKLRTLIFSRKDEKQWLEDLLHPLIRQWIIEKLQASTSAYAILESPLLLETDQKLLVNRILIVDIPEDLQLGRAMARDTNSEQQIKNIMATQLGRKERLNQADDVIDNSKDIQHATKQVNELHTRYLQQAAI